jgi:hypothetical protein
MCSTPKGKNTSNSRNQCPTGATQMSIGQYASFAKVANSAFERREAKKAALRSVEGQTTDRKVTNQEVSPPYLPLQRTAKGKLCMLFEWLHLSVR